MNQYRVTKYNPLNRAPNGVYLLDEWTDFSDIGKTFAGNVFTAEEYKIVEDNYIGMCLAIWEKSGCPKLSIHSIEIYDECAAVPQNVEKPQQLTMVIQEILENQVWAKLECCKLFFHFGWDYYMYIGTDMDRTVLEDCAWQFHLFVEKMQSPYHI